jgi:heme/copper-type cytochrome/quinol oxidase subunit 1
MSEPFPDRDNRLSAWLLSRDAGRQATLFLASTTVFFLIGAVLAVALHWELLTPGGDRFSAETYGALFTMHGLFMMHLFLLPAVFGVLGNLSAGGRASFPRLGLLGWHLHVGGGAVLVYVLLSGGVATGIGFGYVPPAARALTVTAQAGCALALAGVVLTGVNLALSVPRPRTAFAALGAPLIIAGLIGWAPLEGTYFEVAIWHLLGGAGLGVYFVRLRKARYGTAAATTAAGLLLLCVPQLVMGVMEAPRRYHEYAPELQAWQVISAMGGLLLVAGCCLAFWSVLSARRSTGFP